MLTGKIVVITGGAGMIGRAFVRCVAEHGDIVACYADPKLAESLLGWRAQRGLAEICADAWRWQSQSDCIRK